MTPELLIFLQENPGAKFSIEVLHEMFEITLMAPHRNSGVHQFITLEMVDYSIIDILPISVNKLILQYKKDIDG